VIDCRKWLRHCGGLPWGDLKQKSLPAFAERLFCFVGVI
jgi:hypothetical protein